jgi:hypothetical protein
MYILSIYRGPIGDFEICLNKFKKTVINYFHKPKAEFVICGGINIDNLAESYHKQCLKSIPASLNLMSTLNFPSTAIENIVIDSSKKYHMSTELVMLSF